MIETYMGEFKNIEDMKAHCKAGNISEYKKLCRQFNENPSMELSVIMSKRADILHEQYGMTWNEIEAIENKSVA